MKTKAIKSENAKLSEELEVVRSNLEKAEETSQTLESTTENVKFQLDAVEAQCESLRNSMKEMKVNHEKELHTKVDEYERSIIDLKDQLVKESNKTMADEDGLLEVTQELNDELKAVRTENTNLLSEIDRLKLHVDSNLEKHSSQMNSLNLKLKTSQNQTASLKSSLKESQMQVVDLNKNLQILSNKNDTLSGKESAYLSKIENLERSLVGVNEMLSKLKCQEKDTRTSLDSAQSEISVMEKELKEAQRLSESYTEQIRVAEQRKSSLERKFQEASSKVQQLEKIEKEANDLKAKVTVLQFEKLNSEHNSGHHYDAETMPILVDRKEMQAFQRMYQSLAMYEEQLSSLDLSDTTLASQLEYYTEEVNTPSSSDKFAKLTEELKEAKIAHEKAILDAHEAATAASDATKAEFSLKVESLSKELHASQQKLFETESQLSGAQKEAADAIFSWESNHNQWQVAWDNQQQANIVAEEDVKKSHSQELAKAVENAELQGRMMALEETKADRSTVESETLLKQSQIQNQKLKLEIEKLTDTHLASTEANADYEADNAHLQKRVEEMQEKAAHLEASETALKMAQLENESLKLQVDRLSKTNLRLQQLHIEHETDQKGLRERENESQSKDEYLEARLQQKHKEDTSRAIAHGREHHIDAKEEIMSPPFTSSVNHTFSSEQGVNKTSAGVHVASSSNQNENASLDLSSTKETKVKDTRETNNTREMTLSQAELENLQPHVGSVIKDTSENSQVQHESESLDNTALQSSSWETNISESSEKKKQSLSGHSTTSLEGPLTDPGHAARSRAQQLARQMRQAKRRKKKKRKTSK